MKTRLILSCTLLVIATIISCKKGDSFLDKKNTNTLNEQTTFADSSNTLAFLTRIYQNVGDNFDNFRLQGGGHPVTSDEGVSVQYTGTQNAAVIVGLGLISPVSASTNNDLYQMWAMPYANIRRVNVYLSHINQTPLSARLKKQTSAEARFLRAWYYALLIRAYGGVPLIGDKIYDASENFNLKRNTYDECVNYILKECDAAAADLPNYGSQLAQDYGRITSGACLALKSRVLLYAASPLFNGGGYATGGDIKSIAGYASFDKERWNKAAQAALDLMNTGQYALMLDNGTRPGYGFYKVFTVRYNNEYILAQMRANNRDLEGWWLPGTRGGSVYSCVTQGLVDAYGMANGLPISNPTSGYDANNPYVGREPRFYNSIIYNGAPWYLTSANALKPVDTYIGSGADAPGGGKANITSYYCRKMLLEGSSGNTERCWPLMRYAETLLNYAEAVNEYEGPVAKVYNTLIQIRNRAGILPGADGNYGLKTGMSQDEMRTVIQNERQVELAYEEHRAWDVRRWKIADDVLNRTSQGMRVTRVGTGTPAVFTYSRVDVRIHTFPKQFGLYPIPDTEISRNTLLLQNPGW